MLTVGRYIEPRDKRTDEQNNEKPCLQQIEAITITNIMPQRSYIKINSRICSFFTKEDGTPEKFDPELV